MSTAFHSARNHRLKTLFPEVFSGNEDINSENFSVAITRSLQGKSVLEISPCFYPLLDLDPNIQLMRCDRVPFAEIIERETHNQLRKDLGLEVVPLDFVWTDGTSLKDCASNTFDLIVSSHVMEHVPNWINWLWNHYEVLRPGGQVRMILPDAKLSGEYIRRLSTAEYAYECFLNQVITSTPSQVFGALLYITEWNGVPAKRPILEYKRWYGFEESARLSIESYDRHIDIHCWAWTAESLVEDLTVLSEAGLIPFRVVATENGSMPGAVCDEFSVVLERIEGATIPPIVLRHWSRRNSKLPYNALNKVKFAAYKKLKRLFKL